jgi:WhiB family redox-sensing transcriptional regulator
MNESYSGDPTVSPADWMQYGKCRGGDASTFFPSTGEGVLVAQAICRTCPVTEPCLEYALTEHITCGVWGGVSERGRRVLARKRRTAGLDPEHVGENAPARSTPAMAWDADENTARIEATTQRD